MNCLCIYIIYNKHNIVDRYIGYMLKELKTCVSRLVVVCNMPKIIRGMEHIETYADEVFFRENKGFDAGAYKDALCQLIGWDKVLKYDELVLVNDSFFGPFVPMQNIFSQMQEKECDFWGLTKYSKRTDNTGRIVRPEHLQSYFLVIRKNLLHSDCFKNFWNNMPYYTTLWETITHYEMRFTGYFGERGYRYECLADMQPNESLNAENAFNQYLTLPYELIAKRNFPFVKKKALIENHINDRTQESVRLAIDYIKYNTNYDVGMILEKLIREYDSSELQWALGLRYIISGDESIAAVSNENYKILMFVSSPSAFEYIDEYITMAGQKNHVLIYARNGEVAELYRRNDYQVIDCSNRKGIFSAFKSETFSSKYICILQDEDMSSEKMPSYHGKTLFYRKWENLVKNSQHIQAVLQRFEQDSYLGALTIPAPNFGEYFGGFAEKQSNRYTRFESFWIRGSVLAKLQCFSGVELPDCFAALEHTLRNAGYYFGIVESAEYAAMNESNLQLYLNRICNMAQSRLGAFKSIRELELLLYCASYSQVYVYGTGGEARKYHPFIRNIKAYVVSDGQPKAEEFEGFPVLYLSEIEKNETTGMVICLNEENTDKVVRVLETAGIRDYFKCAGL